jgi:hypothetical protein
MKNLKYFTTTLTIIALLVSSCTKIEELNDEEAISELICTTYSPDLGFEKEYEDASIIPDTFNISQTKTPYLVIGWWRKILSVSSNRDIQIEGDTAWATINHHIYGLFNIAYYDVGGDTTFTYNKNFHDLAVRKAVFVREGDTSDRYRGWILKKVSLGEISTKDVPDSLLIGNTYVPVLKNHIDSLKITYTDTLDNIITIVYSNYSELMSIEEVPVVKSGTEIRFDIYASDAENHAFFYKLASWGTPRRMRMVRDPESYTHFYTIMQVPTNVIRGSFAFSIISSPSFRPDNYPYVHHGDLLKVRVR